MRLPEICLSNNQVLKFGLIFDFSFDRSAQTLIKERDLYDKKISNRKYFQDFDFEVKFLTINTFGFDDCFKISKN